MRRIWDYQQWMPRYTDERGRYRMRPKLFIRVIVYLWGYFIKTIKVDYSKKIECRNSTDIRFGHHSLRYRNLLGDPYVHGIGPDEIYKINP